MNIGHAEQAVLNHKGQSRIYEYCVEGIVNEDSSKSDWRTISFDAGAATIEPPRNSLTLSYSASNMIMRNKVL